MPKRLVHLRGPGLVTNSLCRNQQKRIIPKDLFKPEVPEIIAPRDLVESEPHLAATCPCCRETEQPHLN
jgi:hypothetical protein